MAGDAANDSIADCIAAAVLKSDVGGRTAILMTPEFGGRRWVVMPMDTYQRDVERPKEANRKLRSDNAALIGALEAVSEAPHSGWTIVQALARATLAKIKGGSNAG